MSNHTAFVLRYINPFRVKVLMIMFYGTGLVGMLVGLYIASPSQTVMITFMGVVNFGLGAFFTYVLFTQKKKLPDKRKKKRKHD